MRVFKLLDWLLERVVGAIAAVAGLLVALGFVVGITARSILGIALFGVEELILLAVVWFYMLGAILASKQRAHLQADFIPVVVKNETVIIVVRLVATAISIVLAGLFVMWSNELLQWALARGQSTPVFSIPIYFAQASLLTAAIFMTLYLVRDLIDDIQALRHRQENKTLAQR
ncbi:TRAP transporter small permease subunit [Marinobacter sp. TBZ242]|uniref:TRAP transporter small permease protein n=1 Tax=Marinobacter azerbaijanicus TaxID=3050455 RepID=A0ABT7IIP6_9GAMM|nr:TRAP transporter small permease subunit [Marinobacter sp. TBZ242]MDL0434060.1 TRAP transporter small permease subunit [Marinobacter sp. TBZ242]